MLSNKKTLSIINFLLDNNKEVFWATRWYRVKKEKNTGKLLVVCTENGYTTGLKKSDLDNCFADKWAVREYGLWQFPILPKASRNRSELRKKLKRMSCFN